MPPHVPRLVTIKKIFEDSPPGGPLADRNDVVHAYKLFLQRPPESETVITAKTGGLIATLPTEFLSSAEMAGRFGPHANGLDALSARPFRPLLSWAARRLSLSQAALTALKAAFDWRDVLLALGADEVIGPAISKTFPHLWEPRPVTASYDARTARREADFTNEMTALDESGPAPFFSILIPTYESRLDQLEEALMSVRRQTYRSWEIVLSDDGSSNFDQLERIVGRSGLPAFRIRLVRSSKNRGVSAATNVALRHARGSHIGFLDQDDRLSPDALEWVARAFVSDKPPLWTYSDEDRFFVDEGGVETLHNPHLKGALDPEALQQLNYVCHFLVVEARTCRRLGGMRSRYDGAQDHDLILRLLDSSGPSNCSYIPRVLYHWREEPSSLSSRPENVVLIEQRIQGVVVDHLRRRRERGTRVTRHSDVVDGPRRFVARVCRRSPPKDLVAVSVMGLPSCEIAPSWCRGFRPADKNRETGSKISIFVDGAFFPIGEEWWREMAALAARPDVGVVGGRLLDHEGQVEQAGALLGWPSGPEAERYEPETVAPLFRARHTITRSVSVLGFEALAIRSDLLLALDGPMLPRDPVASAELCLRASDLGLINIYTPYATFKRRAAPTSHKGSPSPIPWLLLQQRWPVARERDRFYSPGFEVGPPPFSRIKL